MYYLCNHKQTQRKMKSFRKDILEQIKRIRAGRIFTIRDLSFDSKKTANVTVLLSEQCKKGVLARLDHGAYYRPEEAVFGLGKLPPSPDEILRYLNKKLNGGYLTGAYVYSQMRLTEQMARVMTIATPKPVSPFQIQNYYIECVKSYHKGFPDKSIIPYLRVLDAIKDINHVSGATPQKVYDRLKRHHFDSFSQDELRKIVSLAKKYPPRVRKTVADMLGDLGQDDLQAEMTKTLHPITKFNLSYKRHKA